jgi:hypothetical protein
MAIPTSYLTSTKNLGAILTQMQKGGIPQRVTYEYLKQLGFPSSNDRPIIPVLKALGFLDVNGVPQDRYRRFKDATQAKRVMAEGMREAYSDVFAIDEKANMLDHERLKGMFGRLSGKGDAVTEKMASTFKALAERADFSAPAVAETPETPDPKLPDPSPDGHTPKTEIQTLSLRHDVHVHLPVSEDIKVYDAIFRSLRENLLS